MGRELVSGFIAMKMQKESEMGSGWNGRARELD